MNQYIDDAQRRAIHASASSFRWRSEWPTWVLIAGLYGAWFGTALNARALGLPLAAALLIVQSCLYMSLQHELLHGHPTPWAMVNALLGLAPLAVWFPYAVYRESHLRHHDDAHLTDPVLDPESYFVSAERWNHAGAVLRALLGCRNTFVGRIVIGPAFSIVGTVTVGIAQIAKGNWRVAGAWVVHLGLLALLVTWLDKHCGINPFLFVAGIGYPALSLAAVRSFQEHRPAQHAAERSVINESAWCWRLLFLNNNFHAVHHDLPGVPWFALGSVYHKRRDAYLARNGHFLVRGYGEWFVQHALTVSAPALHPADHRAQGYRRDTPASIDHNAAAF